MSKKNSKPWFKVTEFSEAPSVKLLLSLLEALKTGSVIESDRRRLSVIPTDEITIDIETFPEFEAKFIQALSSLRFDIDLEKLERYFTESETSGESTHETTREYALNEDIQSAIKTFVEASADARNNLELIQDEFKSETQFDLELVFPFFRQGLATIGALYGAEAVRPLIIKSQEITEFYEEFIFVREKERYVTSIAKKELAWIFKLYSQVALAYFKKTDASEDKLIIAHMASFTLTNIGLLFLSHYPDKWEAFNETLKDMIGEMQIYSDTFGPMANIITVTTWIIFRKSLENPFDRQGQSELLQTLFKCADDSFLSDSSVLLSKALRMGTLEHDTNDFENEDLKGFYSALRHYCLDDISMEAIEMDEIPKISLSNSSDEMRKAIRNWRSDKAERIYNNILDITEYYFEDEESEKVLKNGKLLYDELSRKGVLNGIKKIGFCNSSVSGFIQFPKVFSRNLLLAGYEFNNVRYEDADLLFFDINKILETAKTLRKNGLASSSCLVLALGTHLYIKTQEVDILILRKISKLQNRYSAEIKAKYWAPMMALLEFLRTSGTFPINSFESLWISEAQSMESLSLLEKRKNEALSENIVSWHEEFFKKQIGTMSGGDLEKISKLRSVVKNRSESQYEIAYNNMGIGSVILSYSTTIQSYIEGIFRFAFEVCNTNEGQHAFGALIKINGPTLREKPTEIGLPWIASFTESISRARLHNKTAYDKFIEVLKSRCTKQQVSFVEWLSSRDHSIEIRTIQKIRNSVVHRNAKQRKPVSSSLVFFIDDFFNATIREYMDRSGYFHED